MFAVYKFLSYLEEQYPGNILQYAELPVADSALCNSSAYFNGKLTSEMICAGFGGTKGQCQDTCEVCNYFPLFCIVCERSCLREVK